VRAILKKSGCSAVNVAKDKDEVSSRIAAVGLSWLNLSSWLPLGSSDGIRRGQEQS
jgi:hypothetical protein